VSTFVSSMNKVKNQKPNLDTMAPVAEKVEDDSDDELGRDREQVQLDEVSSQRHSPVKSQKAILSPEEVRSAKQQQVDVDFNSKQGVKELMAFQMRIFDPAYEFGTDIMKNNDSWM